MSTGLKLVLEGPKGVRAERLIKGVWEESSSAESVGQILGPATEDDLKNAIVGILHASITEDLLRGMLEELVGQTKPTP